MVCSCQGDLSEQYLPLSVCTHQYIEHSCHFSWPSTCWTELVQSCQLLLCSSTLHVKFTLAGYFNWQLLPSYGRPKSFMRRLQKEVHWHLAPSKSSHQLFDLCWLFGSIHSIFFPSRYVTASANKTSIVLDWTWPSVWHSLHFTQDT